MSNTDSRDKKKAKGRSQTPILAGVLAVVALAALWLSDCIPGFGGGSEGGDAEKADKAEPAEPAAKNEPAAKSDTDGDADVRKPRPLKITVDGRGCSVDGGEYSDCLKLCESPTLDGADSAIVDAKDGSHEKVTAVVECLESKNISASIQRD